MVKEIKITLPKKEEEIKIEIEKAE
jgi:hypothetical protein